MTKSKSAFLLSVQQLSKCHCLNPGELYLWTFTLPTVISIKEAKARWNHLLTLLHQRFPRQCGLRVFELHDTHGLHVHLLCCHWMDVRDVHAIAAHAGWGRINAKKIKVEAAGPYLSKSFHRREQCLKGWRLWEGIGDWTWSKVKNIVVDSAFTRIYQACKRRLGWESNHDFLHRMRVVNCMLRRTIIEGWTDGFGPGNRPYEEFSFNELMGGGLRHPGIFAA